MEKNLKNNVMMSIKCCLFPRERRCHYYIHILRLFISPRALLQSLFCITEPATRDEAVTHSGSSFNALWRTTGFNLTHVSDNPFDKPSWHTPTSSSTQHVHHISFSTQYMNVNFRTWSLHDTLHISSDDSAKHVKSPAVTLITYLHCWVQKQ